MSEVTYISARRRGLTGPDRAAYEEACFRVYQDAFHRNAADPCLQNAASLVRAWNEFAACMELELIDVGGRRN